MSRARAEADASGATPVDLSCYVAHWDLQLDTVIRHDAQAGIASGVWRGQPVVLKVIGRASDESRAAAALRGFAGHGAVRCLATCDDAVLLERAVPGTPLTSLVLRGDDDQATRVLCDVVQRLHGGVAAPAAGFPTVAQWGASLSRQLAGPPHPKLPRALVESAARWHAELCASQRGERLLHGDLHHDNTLLDAARGWLAIDPKGVFGEPEYEIGAALRNPTLDVTRYASPTTLDRRLRIVAEMLGFDRVRMIGWAFSQAVLSSVWAVEDGWSDREIMRGLAFAQASLPLL